MEAFAGWVPGQGSLWVLENQPEPPGQRGELVHGPTAGRPSFEVSVRSRVPPLPHLALQLVVIHMFFRFNFLFLELPNRKQTQPL